MDHSAPASVAALLRDRLDHSGPTLLAAPAARFGAAASDHAALDRELSAALTEALERAERDPFTNPILTAVLDLTRRIDRGEVTLGDLEQLMQRLAVLAFGQRAERLAAYLGETDPAANRARIRTLLETAAEAGFDAYRAAVGRARFGLVLTAHPTFAIGHELYRTLIQLATGHDGAGRPLDEAGRAALLDAAAAAEHRPTRGLTLADEHAWSVEALGHIQDAVDTVNAVVLEVAAANFPERWTEITPELITVASWVGYDLDGRSDIAWSDSFAKRLEIKLHQLRRLRLRLAGVGGMDKLVARLDAAIAADEQAHRALLAAGGDPNGFAAFVQAMQDGRRATLTRGTELLATLEPAMAHGESGRRQALAVLGASVASHGLGLARIHVRLNASQLHNAIGKQVGMETAPDDPSHRRTYMAAINDLLSRVSPVTVNFAALMQERASAKRLFMIVQQIRKYIDGETPVRFLIAETEAGFTLLTALYYARLFGVEDQVEISPLFETAAALERGDAIIEEALRSPHFRNYVRRSGRLCIQFGFSDSGRYLGQMPATFFIERLRLRLSHLLARYALSDVRLILFNTHGESIGRGGHPASLGDRLRYVSPPVTRAAFDTQGIAVTEEVSFQGGDGFVYFLNPAGALAVMRGVLEVFLAPDAEAEGDPIYQQNDFAVEFFAGIRQFFARLVEDPNYAALLGAYGTNLVPQTGSRPVKRQYDGAGPAPGRLHPSELRAIPNNAILQQLGMMANSVAGAGGSIAKDPELFASLVEHSPRFRRAMAMVQAALRACDLDLLSAYIDTLDPGMWLTRSGRTRSPGRARELRSVAALLERLDLHPPLVKLFRRIQADHLALPQHWTSRPDQALMLLHVLRLAAMQRIYLLATHIPDFSPQHGVSREGVLARLLRLDVPDTVARLKAIFPKADPPPAVVSAGEEPATYRSDAALSYAREHEALFEPMLGLHELVLRASTAIAYHIGAVG